MLIYLYISLVYDLYLFKTQKIYIDFSSYSSLSKISLIVYPSKQGIIKKVSKSCSLTTHSSLTQNSKTILFGVIKHYNPLYENSISSFIAKSLRISFNRFMVLLISPSISPNIFIELWLSFYKKPYPSWNFLFYIRY